jgi:AraC-like DNA-binding protein
MADLIRSSALTHYAAVARSVGIDPGQMLKRVGLPVACLQDPDIRVAVNRVGRLLEDSAATAGIDDFGLRMSERYDLSMLGPVALVIREQATVGSAMQALSRYGHFQNESWRTDFRRHGDIFTLKSWFFGIKAGRQSIQVTIGNIYRILRYFLGERWCALEVHFVHSAPAEPRFLKGFFGCKVIFESEFDGIVCEASDMNRPIKTANPALARRAQKYMERIATRSNSIDEKVHELVFALLPTGRCSADEVAKYLGCDRRTIHRRLGECSTTFSEILDAQRANIVVRLVEDSDRSLPEMAEMLGLSAPSALARWFRGRFGRSITEWRSGLRPGSPTAKSKKTRVRSSRRPTKPQRKGGHRNVAAAKARNRSM